MRPEDRVRLAHVHDAASKAIAYSSRKARSDLDDDELLRLALTKLVEIVGEAAKQVRKRAPLTPRCPGQLPRVCEIDSSITTSIST